MDFKLHGSHRATYDAIFDLSVRRHVAWQDVRLMLCAMAGVSQQQYGALVRVTRNGHSHVLHCSIANPTMDASGLMGLRRFLQESRWPCPPPVARQGPHLMVVLHHAVARIYRLDLHESLPAALMPYDRAGFGRHLHHVEADAGSGRRAAEQAGFHAAVAATLREAERIVLFGSGPGARGAVARLFAALRRDHHDLADRVLGWIVVDEGHLTETQLLADARAYYAGCQQTQESSYPC